MFGAAKALATRWRARLGCVLLLACAAFILAACARDDLALLAGRAPSVITHAKHAERVTDGNIAPRGSDWLSDLTSVIESGGGLEWDLGSPQQLAAAWLEGDNNDYYALLGSLDRRSWTTIWEAEPVESAGLQIRSTRALDARARYVRLEPRGGDGNYSVAELALYRSTTAAFPNEALAKQPTNTDLQARELRWGVALAALLAALGLAFALHPALRRRAERMPFGPTSPLLLALGALVLVTALIYRARYRHHTIDDAYISMQYAKNWAAGRGLVFNPGERVEGYSNFLWIAAMTPLWPLAGREPMTFAALAFALCLALAVANLALITAVARRVLCHPLAQLLPACLLAFDDAYTSYAVFALENQLVMFVMLLGLWALVRRFERWELVLGLSLALTAMARPDGALWGAVYVGVALLRVVFAAPSQRAAEARSLLRAGGCFAALFVCYFLLRYSYYGALFPNTFYLKVGDTFAALPRGFEYLLSYLRERGWVPLFALFGLVAFKQLWVRWVFVHALLHMGYVVYVGGDFYSGQRFLMALTPSLALLSAAAVDAVLARWPGRRVELAIAPALLGALLLVRFGTLKDGPGAVEIGVWADVVDRDVRYMQWLKGKARPNASLALGDIGGAGFFADVSVVDVYGVVDPDVARKKVASFGTGKPGHEKVARTEEVLARHPTYIKLGFLPIGRVPRGYYVFNDFPAGLDVGGLLVRDDLARGRALRDTAIHFDSSELADWQREGDAFGESPVSRGKPGQEPVYFANGTFVDSFTASSGDRATGRLLSPEFELEGDYLRLLVGGGRDPLRLTVSLLVDDRRVFSETGTNHELLGRREWDIRALRGRSARLEIVDRARGPWGHILVDEVIQWLGEPSTRDRI